MIIGKKHEPSRGQAGFTLIELALVMGIMGVMMVGTLYGYRIYEETQVKAVYTTVKTVDVALKQFKSKYNALPGDMLDATTRIKGCTGNCANGDGNRFIGLTGREMNGTTASLGEEATQFWYHLQRAGLINLVDPAASPTTYIFGKTSPKVKPNGGLTLRAISTDLCYTATGQRADMAGLWLVWQGKPDEVNAIVDSRFAASLDRKYDDGKPGFGEIRAASGSPTAISDNCRTDLDTYKPSGSGDCYLSFRITRDLN